MGLKQSFIKWTFTGHLQTTWSGAVLGSSYSLCVLRMCPGMAHGAQGGASQSAGLGWWGSGPGERRAFWASCLELVRTTAPVELFIIC